jgi:hypothetical protein
MQRKPLLLCLIISLWGFEACQSISNNCECVAPPETGTSYFYTSIKQFATYEVQEIEYSLTQEPNIKNYQIKELVATFFTDLDGKEILKIERFRRYSDNEVWQIDSVFTAKKRPTEALKTENNQTYVKFVFPLFENQTWDGNAYNTLGKDDYTVKNLHQPFKVGNTTFHKTVTIVQQNDSTLVDLKKRIEVYAEGIGLIYAEKKNITYCSKADCIGKNKIDFGKSVIMKIKDYGTE